MKGILISLLALALLLAPADVPAADYPTREIEYVVGFPPGSSVDHVGRLLSKFAEKHVGKPVVVVNKPGGGGSRGFSSIAAAKPDGYTIGLISQSAVIQPYLMKGVTFNYKKDFRLIGEVAYTAEGIYVKKGGPFDRPLPEIIKMAKEKPNTIKLAVGGMWTGSDVARLMLEDQTGAKFIRIINPGGGQDMVPGILGGHMDIAIGEGAQWAPLYTAGKFNILAVSIDKRDPRFPNIPTLKELGYDISFSVTFGSAAPAGTPDSVINFLSEAFRKAVAEEGYREGSDKAFNTPSWKSPSDYLKQYEKLDTTFQALIKKYDLKPE
ncbi:MAG TPA: tripartite tricarboxylate transporter substrate binding protein [Thermodesulfobacteriota bacterium]|nr:tripartite tricarboxylate transporter substrate binding protein [Thermodesulfobacteriota bacterium]